MASGRFRLFHSYPLLFRRDRNFSTLEIPRIVGHWPALSRFLPKTRIPAHGYCLVILDQGKFGMFLVDQKIPFPKRS
jgi:hypothetical protein